MNDFEKIEERRVEQDARARASIGGSGASYGRVSEAGVLRGGDAVNLCSTQAANTSIRVRAMNKVKESAAELLSHQRLLDRLTPEIEATLWCWQECLRLGLIDARVLTDALQREQRLGRDRF